LIRPVASTLRYLNSGWLRRPHAVNQRVHRLFI